MIALGMNKKRRVKVTVCVRVVGAHVRSKTNVITIACDSMENRTVLCVQKQHA